MTIVNRAVVFIDGGYFDHVIRDELNYAQIDYAKLTKKMVGSIELLRAYYYHCLPYQSNPPTPDESKRFSSAQRFFEALEKLPRFEVRQGKLAYRGKDSQGQPILLQKQVDLLLGVDLVQLAAKGRISHAMILAGDSDLLPAVKMAKTEGVLIHLFHGTKNRPHNDLWTSADERTMITPRYISDILR